MFQHLIFLFHFSGYTRENQLPNSWDKCVLCMCNNRSGMCDQVTGICMNCRYGTTGDHCELCQPNIQGPDCLRCKDGYYGYENRDFDGCRGNNFISSVMTNESHQNNNSS